MGRIHSREPSGFSVTRYSAALATSAMTVVSPALADGHLKVSDEPLELTIHFHWARSKGYIEDWPVEKAACEMTNVCLKDATAGKNTKDQREAMNLLLASGNMPDIVGGHLFKEAVNQGLRSPL